MNEITNETLNLKIDLLSRQVSTVMARQSFIMGAIGLLARSPKQIEGILDMSEKMTATLDDLSDDIDKIIREKLDGKAVGTDK